MSPGRFTSEPVAREAMPDLALGYAGARVWLRLRDGKIGIRVPRAGYPRSVLAV